MAKEPITEAEVVEALGSIVDPELGRSLGDLKMLNRVSVRDNGAIEVDVELPTPAYPRRERIVDLIRSRVSEKLPQAHETSVTFSWDFPRGR